jgi:hypothetical protein
MRSTARDESATYTIGGFIIDAPSGSGVAQPGNVPYAFTRAAAGSYNVTVPSGVTPLNGTMTPSAGGREALALVGAIANGIQYQVANSTGTQVNGSFSWQMLVRDSR